MVTKEAVQLHTPLGDEVLALRAGTMSSSPVLSIRRGTRRTCACKKTVSPSIPKAP